MLLPLLINNIIQLRQKLMCVRGFPRTPGLMILQKNSQDSGYSYNSWLRFITAGYKAESAMGKGTQSDIQEKPGTSSHSPLPVESHFIPPAMSCDNTCERLSIRETQRLSVQDFYWGLILEAQHILKFQTHRRKEGFQDTPHCTNSSGLFISQGGHNPPQIQVLDAS